MQSFRLWKREYRAVFPELGFSFDNLNDKEGLKIAFSVEKDLTRETNKTQLKIWNLSRETRAKIEPADTAVELYAGYRDNGGPLKMFSGTVRLGQSKDEGQDATTELALSDGLVPLRDSFMSLSHSPGTSGDKVIQTIAANMGLPLVFGKDVNFGSYDNGYSFTGGGGDALDEVCAAFGCTWSIQNGVLQVILAGRELQSRGIVFAPDSGLIGSPSRITRGNPYADKSTPKRTKKKKSGAEKPEKRAGWEITTLLSPTVNPGDAVKVESRDLTGWFRVETAKHEGDSHGGNWQSTFELIEGLVDRGEGDGT